MKKLPEDTSRTKIERMLHVACGVDMFMPRINERPVPKDQIAVQAARWAITQPDCPDFFRSVQGTTSYILATWPYLMYLMSVEGKVLPTYVTGFEGGYKLGRPGHAHQQIEHQTKLVEGVAKSNNTYNHRVIELHPKEIVPIASVRVRNTQGIGEGRKDHGK